MNKNKFLIVMIFFSLIGGSLLLNASSNTGFSDSKYTKKALIVIKPNEDVWELLFSTKPDVDVKINSAVSSTGPLCFPRGVPQSIASSGKQALVKLYDSNGNVVDVQSFGAWRASVGLPKGQSNLIGSVLGGLLGGSTFGGHGAVAGALAGYGVGGYFEEQTFYAEAVFPCLSPGSYSVKAFIFDDDGDEWFNVDGGSFVIEN